MPDCGPDEDYPCGWEEDALCDNHATEALHDTDDHTFCPLTCHFTVTNAQLWNGLVYKNYPGSKGMLKELIRRVRAGEADDLGMGPDFL